jgi:hypothetical protein
MSDREIRNERTHGLKATLPPQQRVALLAIREMPGYEALLDLIEMCCIEQEGNLVNTPVDQPSSILAEHQFSKAFWQVFTALQRKVEQERAIQDAIDEQRRDHARAADEYDEAQIFVRP